MKIPSLRSNPGPLLLAATIALGATSSFGQDLVAFGSTVMGGVRGKQLVALDKLASWEAKARKAWTVHAPGQPSRSVSSAKLAWNHRDVVSID